MDYEKQLETVFFCYIFLSGLWDKIKDNLAFKIDDIVEEVYPESKFMDIVTYRVNCKVNAVYTYYDQDSGNIIWEKRVSFKKSFSSWNKKFSIGDRVPIDPKYCDARVSESNFSMILNIPLLKILCNYFNIDEDMLMANYTQFVSLHNEIWCEELKLGKIKKIIENNIQAIQNVLTGTENISDEMEKITVEINRYSKIYDETLKRMAELKDRFHSIEKGGPQLKKI